MTAPNAWWGQDRPHRRPTMLAEDGLMFALVAAQGGVVVKTELELLVESQRADMAGDKETTAEVLEDRGGNEGQGGPTNAT